MPKHIDAEYALLYISQVVYCRRIRDELNASLLTLEGMLEGVTEELASSMIIEGESVIACLKSIGYEISEKEVIQKLKERA